jgi:hypothetical protein
MPSASGMKRQRTIGQSVRDLESRQGQFAVGRIEGRLRSIRGYALGSANVQKDPKGALRTARHVARSAKQAQGRGATKSFGGSQLRKGGVAEGLPRLKRK